MCTNPRVKSLLNALAASVPKLKEAATGDDSAGKQLWRVVSCLQQRDPWGPALAATPGLLADIQLIITVPELPRDIIAYCLQHVGVRIDTACATAVASLICMVVLAGVGAYQQRTPV